MNEHQNLTWADIKEMYAETGRLLKEREKQSVKDNKQLKKRFAETDARIEKQNKERNDVYEKRHNEWNENFEKEKRETDRRLAQLEKLIGGIGNNNGEMAEEYFFNVFRRDKTFVNEKFDKIKGRFCYRGEDGMPEAEYDILLFNGKSAAIIEVKYNAKPENVSIEKLLSRAKLFRTHYPDCKNHNVYLGVAAMSFKSGMVKELHKAGIATVHQIGKKMIIYDKTVKVF